MRKTALITGAAGGIGRSFVRELLKKDLDEIWCIDREEELLAGFTEEFGDKIIPMAVDLSSLDDLQRLRRITEEKKPEIRYLVNCAGMADFLPSIKFSDKRLFQTVAVNCTAPIVLSNICIPFMTCGSHIINMASIGAFTPLPYINLYCASKAFLRYYSRALHAELKKKQISVTAVCPGWVDTNMLPRKMNDKEMKYEGMSQPKDVVKKAMRDAESGNDMSVYTLLVKWRHLLCKIMPQKICINLWAKHLAGFFEESSI